LARSEESVENLWQTLFSWAVIGPVGLLLIGIGVGVMSMAPPEFTVARVCLSSSALILLIRSGVWIVGFSTSWQQRALAAFLIFGAIGVSWTWAYSWVSSRQPAAFVGSNSDYDDSQYEFLNLTPQEKADIDALKAPMFRYKAELLDLPSYYKMRASKERYRIMLESLEVKYKCLIDVAKLTCLPKPPKDLRHSSDEVDIDVPVRVVLDEASKGHFWVIHDQRSKLRIPIVLFVSLTNRLTEPIQISLLYLEARTVGGWADVRMADTLSFDERPLETRPLVLQATNGCMSMGGQYLLPSLYDRVIQPGNKIEGWIVAEYPRGFKTADSMGEMRISLVSANRWAASKVFNANPRTFGDDFVKLHGGTFYFVPLETLITEEP
jgi:hypothetical protein